jgi:hypothetical protein
VKYSVRWSREALDALTEIWLENPGQRDDIRRAAARIDRILVVNPDEQGESRGDARRILIESPLVVNFVVDDVRYIVRVLKVRLIKPRRTN